MICLEVDLIITMEHKNLKLYEFYGIIIIYKTIGGIDMKVAIATDSPEKIKGIKLAFSRFFDKETEVVVFHRSVESGVSDQPFDEETYLGAKNRVKSLISSEDTNADYYVSCEAGIESCMGIYFNVQVVCIFDKKARKFVFGKSAGWQVPSEDIEVIKEINLDSYLRRKGITKIEELLGPEYSRASAVAQATEFALASLTRL